MKKADAISQELNTMGLRLYVNAENPGGIAFYEMCGYEQKFARVCSCKRSGDSLES